MSIIRNIALTALSVGVLGACSSESEPTTTPSAAATSTPSSEPVIMPSTEPVNTPSSEPITIPSPIPTGNPPIVNPTPIPIVRSSPSPSAPDQVKVETFDIPLSGIAKNGSTGTNTIYPAARPGGGLTLGWNELDQGHLMRVDENMNPEGIEWDLDGLMIVGMLGLPDDGVAVLVIDWTESMTNSFSTDRHLRLFIYDAEGNKTRETSIVGGTGTGIGSSWFSWGSSRSVDMKRNGDRFSIFTKISNIRTEEVGTHQGDLYVEVDADGNLDESARDFWSASHSNRQHLVLGPNNEGLRLIVGDANPYGLEYQTNERFGDVVVWPPEDQIEAGKAGATSTVSAGDLCGFQYRDGRLFATVATVKTQPFNTFEDFGDVILLSWPLGVEQGDEISGTWLSETPDIAEQCPTLSALGSDSQLAVWGVRDGTTATLTLLDRRGEVVSGPTESTAPFHRSSLAITMPDGSVVWTYAERNATKVQVSVAREL